MPPSDRHSGVELRHLRYLVAVAEAGTFTQAAERMFMAQPTLSQQVRRLEQTIGTPLLSRQRDGLHLTAVGSILLEESRTVLSLFEHGLRRSRQAAGLRARRPCFEFIDPPSCHSLAVARVALGLGYAILPEGTARFYHRRDIRYLHVAGLDEVQVALAQHKARPMREFDRFARIARHRLGGGA